MINQSGLRGAFPQVTVCIVGMERFVSEMQTVLDRLSLTTKVVAETSEKGIAAVQALRPDVVILNDDLLPFGQRLAAVCDLPQLYVVAGETAAEELWAFVWERERVEALTRPFAGQELALRLRDLLAVGDHQPAVGDPTNQQESGAEPGTRTDYFHDLFDVIDEAVFISNEAGEIIEVNQAVCRLYDLTYEEAVQMRVGAFSAQEGNYSGEEAKRRLELAKTHGPQQFEWRAKRGDGEWIWIDVNVKYVRLDGQPRYIVVVRDITKRKHMMETLQEIEAHYGALVQHVHEGIVILQDAVIKADNHGLADMLGYTADELEETRFLDYVAPHDQETVVDLYDRFLNWLEVPYLNEVQLVHRNGSLVDVEFSGAHTEYNGRAAVLVVVRNISGRKRVEEALSRSEEKFAKVFEASPNSITIATWPDGRLLDVNREFERLTGFTKAEAVGQLTTALFMPADERKRVRAEFHERQQYQDIEFLAQHKSGRRFPASLSFARLELDGQPCTIAVVHDLSQQKEAEEALRVSEEKFAKAFHASPEAIVIATWPEGVVLDLNQEFERMTGYTRREVLEQRTFNFYAPNERQHVLSELKKRPQRRNIEFVSQRKSGEVFPAALSFDFLEIDGQIYSIEIVRDLSEQQMAEEALRASEEKFAKAFFASPDSVTISTVKEGVILEANEGFENVFGYSRREVIGRAAKDLNLYADLADREKVIATLQQEGFVRNAKLIGRHKSGRRLVTSVSMEPIQVGDEPCIVTIVRDITEQEQTLAALRASEKKFATIFQFSPNALSINNLRTGKLIEVNAGFEDITGYGRDEVMGKTVDDISLYFEPEERGNVRALFQAHGQIDDYEFVARHKSGKRLICTLSARLVEIGGDPCALVLVRDITEARQAEEELRRSEALLRETQALARLGSFSLDMKTRQLYWSDVLYELFGLPLGQPLTYDDYAARVHPDDLPLVEEKSAEAFQNRLDHFSFEHRVIRPDGTERYLWIQNYLELDETGWITRVRGTAQDISERRRTEEALYKSEEMARAFQEKLRALHEVTMQLSNENSLDAFFRSAVTLGQSKLGFERVELFLFDDEPQQICGVYGADENGRVRDQRQFKMPMSAHPAVQELLDNNMRVREWHEAHQRYLGQVLGTGWVALAILRDGEKGIGLLSVDNHLTKQMPPPYTTDLIALYGNTLGHLLTRKQAELNIERYVQHLQLMQQMDRAILRADSPETMANSVLHSLQEILNSHFVDIARYDADRRIIYSLGNTVGVSLTSEDFAALSPEIIERLTQGDPYTLPDITDTDNPSPLRQFWLQQGIRSITVIPLVDTELLGTLYIGLDRRGGLNAEKLAVVEQTATQLAIALRQNTLYSRIENYADELEHLVEKRTAQLEAKATELEAFTYSVSHDLRAPLRAMDGFSRMLTHNYADALPDKAHHYLNRIQYNAQKMGRLIDDLLKLSRLGRKEITFKQIKARRLLENVIGELEADNQLNEAEIVIHKMPPFYGDDVLLKQVWFNLITNAIKYAKKGERPQIEIGSLTKDEQIVYYIKDQGIGFDMAYVDKLFGVFQRLHNASEYDGTGIGLATVKRIIGRHGGQIWAEADINKGATFYFTLEKEMKEMTQPNAER